MQICGRCMGCPAEDDPEPRGVIRRGVPYSDSGKVLPLCPNCGRPNTAYRGGDPGLCEACDPRNVLVAPADRPARIATLVADGWSDEDIAAELGVKPGSMRKLRSRYGIRREPRPLPFAALNADGFPDGELVDEQAVERALAGERVPLSDAELMSALQIGTARGAGLSSLAPRLGINHVAAKRLLNGGLSPRKAKHAVVARLLRAAGPGCPNSAIAAEAGVSKETVRRARLRLAGDQASGREVA